MVSSVIKTFHIYNQHPARGLSGSGEIQQIKLISHAILSHSSVELVQDPKGRVHPMHADVMEVKPISSALGQSRQPYHNHKNTKTQEHMSKSR